MKKLYYDLYHEYELNLEDGISDMIKFIGVFDSEEKANETIDYLITKNGFKDHPRDCFTIYENDINLFSWTTGFITVGESLDAMDDEK